jgi:hypothetical protein
MIDTISSQSVNKLPRISYKDDVVKFTHRPLSPEESKIYDALLEQALSPKIFELASKDFSKFCQSLNERWYAISELLQSPHVKLIKPLVNFIRQLQPYYEQLPVQIKDISWVKTIGAKEVDLLARCADEEVIESLIEFLGHPIWGVRSASLENLQKIIRLPKEYRFGELSWESLEDVNKRKEVVKFLKDWWKENKGKVKINWKAAWRVR